MSHSPTPVTARQFAVLLAILLVAAGLRFYGIGKTSLWTDELWSIEMAMGHGSVHDAFPDGVIRTDQPALTDLAAAAPWWHIWTHVTDVTHPPIYYLLLRAWMDLFGTSPTAARSLSAIFSLAAIALLFDVCRLIHSPNVAFLAAALMALSIGQIDIAREARSYSLVTLELIACCDVLLRILFRGDSWRRLAGLALLLAAMFLTHYLSAGAILGLLAFAMVQSRGKVRWKIAGAFGAAGILVAAVWGHEFSIQLRTLPFSDPTFFKEVFSDHLVRTVARLARLPLQFFLGEDLGMASPAWLHALACAGMIAVLVCSLCRREFLLWILLALGAIGFVAAIDLLRDSTLLQFSRYTILAAPALCVLVAGTKRPRFLVPAALLAVLAAVAIWQVIHPPPPRQDFTELAGVIDAHAAPDELLVFFNESHWLSPGTWYMGLKYYSPASNHPWLTLRSPPDAALLEQLKSRPAIWLISRSPEVYGPILFPGFKPDLLWHTSAGGVCLLRRAD